MIKTIAAAGAASLFGGVSSRTKVADAAPTVLRPENFKHYIDLFNASDEELYPGAVRNTDAWSFLRDNIPLFECPDETLEKIYYFRWWTYRKHIKRTPDGYLVTEFLPDVPWIDEDLNPFTGDWIARTIQKPWTNGIRERGKDYNHSTFCDLIINGLVGLRPRANGEIEVKPLVPDGV